jgi:hypothetical protein
MAIETLNRLLPPPLTPEETKGDRTWDEVEEILGTRLPGDYKRFVASYGTGSINSFITVFNPFSSSRFVNLIDRRQLDLEGMGELRQNFPQQYAHDKFPPLGGILPFASTDNGEIFYWKTDGDPDQWTVVAYESRGPKYFSFAGPMTEFLAGLLARTIKCEVLPASFPSRASVFTPISVTKG